MYTSISFIRTHEITIWFRKLRLYASEYIPNIYQYNLEWLWLCQFAALCCCSSFFQILRHLIAQPQRVEFIILKRNDTLIMANVFYGIYEDGELSVWSLVLRILNMNNVCAWMPNSFSSFISVYVVMWLWFDCENKFCSQIRCSLSQQFSSYSPDQILSHTQNYLRFACVFVYLIFLLPVAMAAHTESILTQERR